MASLEDRLRSALQALGDAAPETTRLALGDPDGDPVQLPGLNTRDPGLSYAEDGFLDLLLKVLGQEFETVVYGRIQTNATGVAPTASGQGFGTPSKDEGTDTLTVLFDTDFASNNYYVNAVLISEYAMPLITSPVVGGVFVAFKDAAGLTLDINNRTVSFIAIGKT